MPIIRVFCLGFAVYFKIENLRRTTKSYDNEKHHTNKFLKKNYLAIPFAQ